MVATASLTSFIALLGLLTSVNGNLLFEETFATDPFIEGKWKLSSQAKYAGQPVKVLASSSAPVEFANDQGVQLTQEMKHYGFGVQFDTPITIANKDDLVIQYELKLEETLNCGGAYIKLLRDVDDITQLDSSSPYSIMFGPDKCGGTNKVHFILQHQNPLTKVWEEKHFNETIPVRADRNTHLYTLVLRKDQSFDIFVDEKIAKSGNLLTHMVPAINPPEFIDDPTDSKPEDWVDEPMITDPDAVKPADWDEDAPRKIPDVKATKPAAWLDDAPTKIPDPSMTKPVDWDDEEDGEWEAPLIDNPECEKAGCGVWTQPLIPNPAYKGKWIAPKIANPAYIGEWKARQIPNPAYFEDQSPLQSLAPMTALAVEVWTINGGIHFDNFVIGSIAAVQEFTQRTFRPKVIAEKKKLKAEQKTNSANDLRNILASGTLLQKANAVFREIPNILLENPATVVAGIISFTTMVLLFIAVVYRPTDDDRRGAGRSEPLPTDSAAENATEQDENVETKKDKWDGQRVRYCWSGSERIIPVETLIYINR